MNRNSFGSCKRVFMLGIDGMGAFNRYTDTPNMDRLFAHGAVTYQALASKPTVSAQCWTSMLTGAIPEVHGLTNDNMHPIPGLPTVFAMIRAAEPDAETAAFTDWSPIAREILGPEGGLSTYDVGPDDELCEKILAYLEDHDPRMLFIQFDSVDGAGHTFGYGSEGHLARISHVDGLLGRLIAKYEEKGMAEDTLFLVTADHGGTEYCGHGDWSDTERFVFLGVAGKTVTEGQIGEASLRDYPAIVLHALGMEAPAFDPAGYAAQMPVGVFADVGVTDRRPVYPEFVPYEPVKRSQPQSGTPEALENFIDPDSIRFWLTFENGVEDASGRCSVTTERGIVKTYNNGYIGKIGEFGGGVLCVDGWKHSDVFSVAFWFHTTEDWRWMDLFSNADGIHDSFSIAPYGERVGIYIKEPDGNQTDRTHVGQKCYEASAINLWTHFLFEVNTVENRIHCYVNFEKIEELKVGRPLAPHFDRETFRMGCAQHNNELFYKVFDDIMILDGPARPDALKRYYKL